MYEGKELEARYLRHAHRHDWSEGHSAGHVIVQVFLVSARYGLKVQEPIQWFVMGAHGHK